MGEGNVFSLFISGGGGYPYPIMLCNITQNAMGQPGGTLPGSGQGGTLVGGYPGWGGTLTGGYSGQGVPWPGGYPGRAGGYPVRTT